MTRAHSVGQLPNGANPNVCDVYSGEELLTLTAQKSDRVDAVQAQRGVFHFVVMTTLPIGCGEWAGLAAVTQRV